MRGGEMKKYYIHFFLATVLILMGFINVWAIGPPAKAEKVFRLVYMEEPHAWYVEQSKLWEKELQKRPTDASAWYNYFMANKYSKWHGNKTSYVNLMDSILVKMGELVPDSYEYNYLKFYNGDRDITLIEKAYRIDPKRPDALYEFIMHYEHSGEQEKLKKFCNELYQTRDIASGLLNYNYNMLASTENNAILFTNGDNDTYPGWVLQQAIGVRQDVTILNLHLTFVDRKYLSRKLSEKGIHLDVESFSKDKMHVFFNELCRNLAEKYPDIPVYAAVTINNNSLKGIKDNLYLVGLVFKYSMKRFDNLVSIKNNIENNLHLDYLEYDWYSESYLINSGLDQLHVNYVVLFLKLAEDFHNSENPKAAQKWKQKALYLAKKADNQEFIEHINELDW